MTLSNTAFRRSACWLVLVSAASAASAADLPDTLDMALSDDGAYVLDARAGVAWSRCVEGMGWNGTTCVGTPLLLNRTEAMALALDRGAAQGAHWRVPRVSELQRLVHKAAASPGLDPKLFPATPGDWHWSATAAISSTPVNQYNYGNIAQGRREQNANHIALQQGWAVNLVTGEARGDVAKQTRLPVRLVLPLD